MSIRIRRRELGFPVLELSIGLALIVGLGFLAAVVAGMGSKGILVAGGATAVVAGLLAVRNRTLLVVFLTVAGMQFMLHKSFGPIDTTISSGAEAVYVTSVDVLVALLYAMWWFQGTLAHDLSEVFKRRVMLLPLLLIVPGILSLPAATNAGDAFAELVRMGWMWALFVYVAARLTSRREVAWIVAGLFVVALVQCAVVLYQYKTGGHAGLGLFGEDPGTYLRTGGTTETFRPAGTTIHPDILAAITGPIGLIGLALAISLRDLRWRLVCLACAGAAFAPLFLSQTRAAIVAAAAAALLVVVAGLWTRKLSWVAVLAPIPVAGIAAMVYWPKIQSQVLDNFGTSHFQLEIDSRVQLNNLALDVIRDHPIIGVGLNNFMAIIAQYDHFGLIYPGYPVHNIYLLQFAETGFFGLAALVATLVVAVVLAVRLARTQDWLLSGVGMGIFAALVFFMVEEMLSFSLRADAPLALFWLMAGLSVACLRIAQQTSPEPAEVADEV
jgi:O-antigen ligase